MKPHTIKRLQHFEGKVCSILTSSVAKSNFNDTQFSDFFVCIVEEVSEDGVFGRHPMTSCLSFFSWPQIVGIFQEQVIDQTDPQYENILAEIKKAPPEQQANIVPVNPAASSPYVDPDVMASLAEQAKEMRKVLVKK